MTTFSDLLRADRGRAGLTVEQVARRLGVPLSPYRKLRGRRTVAELGDVRPDRRSVGWPRSFGEG